MLPAVAAPSPLAVPAPLEVTDAIKRSAGYLHADFSVQLKNDDLSTFLCSWRYTMAGMRNPPRSEDAEALFIEQVRKSNTLKMDVAHYDRQDEGHPDKTMEYLTRCITQILSRRREHSTRDAQRRALSEGGVHPTSISFTGAGKDEKGKREKRDKRRSSSEGSNDSRQKRGREKKRGGGRTTSPSVAGEHHQLALSQCSIRNRNKPHRRDVTAAHAHRERASTVQICVLGELEYAFRATKDVARHKVAPLRHP